MILRLFIYCLVMGLPGLYVIYKGYKGLIQPRLEERAFKQLGALRNRFTCASPDCIEYVNPTLDDAIFEHKKWWHRKCLKKLLSSTN